MDIPIWVVDLRHELTHGKLPRLALCRKGEHCWWVASGGLGLRGVRGSNASATGPEGLMLPSILGHCRAGSGLILAGRLVV